MTRRALSALTALSLTACGQPAPTANEASAPAANDPAPVTPTAETANAPLPAGEPAAIPAKFHGTWANTPNACANQGHYSRLVVSDRSLRYADFVLVGEEFTLPTPDEFAVKGKVEGKDDAAAAHFSLNKHGDLLRDEAGGGTVRVKCA